ncbi:MAG: RNA-directed DNA polymerase [Actinobacteria bacterium]|nr:RNA-directed DNA polymerase [Actinomycetota bacterium]
MSARRARSAARIDPVPKPGGGVRLLATLDPADARDYACAVAALVPAIEGALGAEVLANRVWGRGSVAWTRLEPWRPARRRFARAASSLGGTRTTVVADVRECYGSIGPALVEGTLSRIGGGRREVAALVRLLDRVSQGGVRGLPVGPDPSAVLANAVLSPVDLAIARTGALHLRWVDDVAIFAQDGRAACTALEAAEGALDQLGLVLRGRKTRILAPGQGIGRTPISGAAPLS